MTPYTREGQRTTLAATILASSLSYCSLRHSPEIGATTEDEVTAEYLLPLLLSSLQLTSASSTIGFCRPPFHSVLHSFLLPQCLFLLMRTVSCKPVLKSHV